MPYKYIGKPSVHYGKRLFKLLCQLKNFGQGRIVYLSHEQNQPEPSFYRILLAQPEMDDKLENGRIVAEKIQNGKRRLKPVILSSEAQYPDWKLVPKDEEDKFCQWDKIKDFVHSRDAEPKPKYFEMPPLLKLVIARNRESHGETVNEDNLVLPAHKIYEGEHRLEDRIEPNSISHYISEQFATHKDFSVDDIPSEEWLTAYQKGKVGYRHYLGRFEGSYEWKEWKKRSAE